jgi:glycosyltransferase involved in cell wall biosynthesis
VNDASDDFTPDIVNSIKDSRIKYTVHEKNRGLAAARNTGIRNSFGGYITFLDDDDEWADEKISLQIEAFRNINIAIGLMFTNGYSEYENNFIIRERAASGIIYNPQFDTFFPLRVLVSPPSSWMLPRAVVEKIGYFDETMYNNWDDGDYLVRTALSYPLYFLNENLVTWHALLSHVNMISANLIKGKEIFLSKNLETMKNDPEYLFRFYRALGKDMLNLDKLKARKYLFKAIRMRFFDLSTLSKILKTYSKSRVN